MHFKLIREFKREDFPEDSTWAQYYEPGDIDTLVKLGYDRQIVHNAIEAVDWSDDYWFPIPNGSEAGLFMFEYREAQFLTPDGHMLDGFVCNEGHAIGLFGLTDYWMINENLLSLYEENRSILAQDLGLTPNESLLPLKYEVQAIGGKRSFPTNSTNKP